MSASNQLRKLIEDVRKTGKERALGKQETEHFYSQIRKEMSPVIEKIREEERAAHEEAKKITLA